MRAGGVDPDQEGAGDLHGVDALARHHGGAGVVAEAVVITRDHCQASPLQQRLEGAVEGRQVVGAAPVGHVARDHDVIDVGDQQRADDLADAFGRRL
jgi:hypothetical protein